MAYLITIIGCFNHISLDWKSLKVRRKKRGGVDGKQKGEDVWKRTDCCSAVPLSSVVVPN